MAKGYLKDVDAHLSLNANGNFSPLRIYIRLRDGINMSKTFIAASTFQLDILKF